MKSWQDAAIYFILIDRFYNGDSSNDDQGQGEFDPNNDDCFHGGDLKGVRAKLPHIRDLGFDAIWITPPVHNQWTNPYIPVRGYHGYWAYDFMAVDPHFGTLEDYRGMVDEAHRLGLRVIQDIVVNHTGNFFTIDAKGYDPTRPERNWRRADPLRAAPADPLFKLNDPNNPEHKAAAVYNFTPNIADFKSREQTLTWSMGDLDDLNLRNPAVLSRLKAIYRYWIDAVGVDAFRVDTVYYTPEEFYDSFLYDEDASSPGVKVHAERAGKKDFLVFGEVWSYEYRAIDRYIREGGRPRLDSAVDLPLNEALAQVFYRRAPTERLRRPLAAARANRQLWVNFLDNHDVERMSARAGWEAVQQSLVALFTLPGIPCITYGTEAGLTRSRQDMLDDKLFDLKSPRAAFLRGLIQFRKRHPAFSRGRARVEQASQGPGLLGWSVTWRGERYDVLFNTSTEPRLCALGAGEYQVLLSSEGRQSAEPAFVFGPQAYLVLKSPAPIRRGTEPEAPLSLREVPAGPVAGRAALRFKVRAEEPVSEVALLANDDYGRRLRIADPEAGRFELDTAALGNGKHRIRLVGRTESGALALSEPAALTVRNKYRLLARVPVAAADKGGIGARLYPPADPSYDGQVSLEEAAVYTSGRDLQLRLRMARVTRDWNPPLGFDHVYFSVFFDLPGRPGKRFFPKLGYSLPDFDFNAGFLLYGWDARSFGCCDSTEDSYGAPLSGEVSHAADVKRRAVRVTFSRDFFDGLEDFAGVGIFISTWDGYLGELRGISCGKEDWSFYTLDGVGIQAPRIFDHVRITL